MSPKNLNTLSQSVFANAYAILFGVFTEGGSLLAGHVAARGSVAVLRDRKSLQPLPDSSLRDSAGARNSGVTIGGGEGHEVVRGWLGPVGRRRGLEVARLRVGHPAGPLVLGHLVQQILQPWQHWDFLGLAVLLRGWNDKRRTVAFALRPDGVDVAVFVPGERVATP